MRGSSKSLPKYAKHKASGQAVVHLSGTDFYLGPHNTKASNVEYDRLIGKWLANWRRLPVESNEKPISIVELTAAYLKFAKGYYVKNGKVAGELASVKISIRHLNRNYAKSFAKDFGPLALDAVREQMIEAGNCRKYINGNIGRIKRMFKWGASKELFPVTVYQALQTVVGLKRGKSKAMETSPIMPVDDATVAATSKQATPIMVADMIRLQQLTGCRPGEVCAICRGEVDRREPVWRYRSGSHKMEHKGRELGSYLHGR